MKIFPIKLSINLKGTNQALYLQNSDGMIKLVRVNHRGQRSVVFEIQKTTKGYLKLWFRQRRRIIAACCAVLVVGSISFYAIRMLSAPFEERVYKANYAPFDKNTAGFRSSYAVIPEAVKQYEDGDINAALTLLRVASTNGEREAEINFYTGLALMGEAKHYEAAGYFESAIKSNREIAHFAYWYLALCQLDQNQLETAKYYLTQIVEHKLYNHKKAKRLVRKIEKRL